MFNWFKPDPRKKLQQEYEALLTAAMQAQRNGDIRRYSELNEKADKVRQALEAQPRKAG